MEWSFTFTQSHKFVILKLKLLIITYYWPPAGGAGVQRWVKLTKYLAELDTEIHVLTVDPDKASYMHHDLSLTSEVADNVRVHTTDSFEIINHFARIVGKDKVPTAGFSNVDNSTIKSKVINFFRSNLFIPDPRRGWIKYAFNKALQLIDEFGIETVITTSPPHSSQLIGLKLKEKLKINWIADLRDPWTDIYYYKILMHSFLSKRIDRYYEKKVLENSDRIITVNDDLGKLFEAKSAKIEADKIFMLPNGYDHQDFEGLRKERTKEFIISYTGTMSDLYNPDAFLLALADFIHNDEIKDIRFNITGSFSSRIRNKITAMKLDTYFDYTATLPHSEINQVQKNADLLLLLIPEVKYDQSIVTGKIFEYMASGNPILCLGPKNGSAANILTESKSGQCFDRKDIAGIKDYIIQAYLKFKEGETNQEQNIILFSRKEQAKKLYQWLNDEF